MGNHTSTGSWVTLKSASCYTTIKKSSNSRTVTMTLTSVDKVATWDAGSTNFSPSSFGAYSSLIHSFRSKSDYMTAAEVNGYLHYKRLGKLKDAIYANYNNDRVVFYENDWSGKDFVGFVCRQLLSALV
jgi:hypothetical protein